MLSQLRILLKQEFLTEWRDKNGLASVLIYLVSATFVCFLAFNSVAEDTVWVALLWLIILFSSFYTVSKAFYKETPGRLLYSYTLVSPQAFIMSKMIFNGVLMAVTSIVNYIVYALFLGDLALNHVGFILALVLGSFALSSTASMASAIAAKAGQLRLATIVGLPIVLPALMIIIRLSMMAVQGKSLSALSGYLLSLAALNIIILGLAYLLFPYLWRD